MPSPLSGDERDKCECRHMRQTHHYGGSTYCFVCAVMDDRPDCTEFRPRKPSDTQLWIVPDSE